LPVHVKISVTNKGKKYEYLDYTDNKYVDSIYNSLNIIKARIVWIGVCNIFTENEEE
jgi:hypothetical protein